MYRSEIKSDTPRTGRCLISPQTPDECVNSLLSYPPGTCETETCAHWNTVSASSSGGKLCPSCTNVVGQTHQATVCGFRTFSFIFLPDLFMCKSSISALACASTSSTSAAASLAILFVAVESLVVHLDLDVHFHETPNWNAHFRLNQNI